MSSALTKWSQDIIFELVTQRCLSIIWTAVVKGSQSPVKTAVFIFFFQNNKLNRTHFQKIRRQGLHRLCQLNNSIFLIESRNHFLVCPYCLKCSCPLYFLQSDLICDELHFCLYSLLPVPTPPF